MTREYYQNFDESLCKAGGNGKSKIGYWVWTGSYCYHDLVTQRIKDADWHKASLHLYLDPLDFPNLTQMEIVIAGPKQGTMFYDWLTLQKYTSYYYLNNNHLDKSSCAARVGLRDGYVLSSIVRKP